MFDSNARILKTECRPGLMAPRGDTSKSRASLGTVAARAVDGDSPSISPLVPARRRDDNVETPTYLERVRQLPESLPRRLHEAGKGRVALCRTPGCWTKPGEVATDVGEEDEAVDDLVMSTPGSASLGQLVANEVCELRARQLLRFYEHYRDANPKPRVCQGDAALQTNTRQATEELPTAQAGGADPDPEPDSQPSNVPRNSITPALETVQDAPQQMQSVPAAARSTLRPVSAAVKKGPNKTPPPQARYNTRSAARAQQLPASPAPSDGRGCPLSAGTNASAELTAQPAIQQPAHDPAAAPSTPADPAPQATIKGAFRRSANMGLALRLAAAPTVKGLTQVFAATGTETVSGALALPKPLTRVAPASTAAGTSAGTAAPPGVAAMAAPAGSFFCLSKGPRSSVGFHGSIPQRAGRLSRRGDTGR
ncbi:hypothetical protein GGTG_04954 [Gaeumannomyces tritici R3-111a-1]|uniref:Uncharacterized protein n=1 Tax=Gaeumannomyces tritici (strain R3-111a-1) TaxID=644352 RepID=J3NUJ8_GAET3|nr:hypothetical protein GGTG_04954 [Gaeumannomyces tritici R3-111a-1]EJT79871.1 hypothetical protein GGTG_04954 [Gaeumannomyces tritici R3-111a-1]